MSAPEEYARRVRSGRKQKDQFFEHHPGSPLPSDHRDDFDGLDYFPPDPAYRFELDLDEHDETEPITVATTTEGEQEYRRWGEFRFAVGGEEVTLQAYRSDPEEDRLWVPFRDETNGEETYGAGRYLDLEPDAHRTEDGAWVLDFNEAYNPYCAYSEMYECPLIPMENWLSVRIEAGEKAYGRSPGDGDYYD